MYSLYISVCIFFISICYSMYYCTYFVHEVAYIRLAEYDDTYEQ